MGEESSGQTPGRRQVVKFTFFRVDPAWRRLSSHAREAAARQFCDTVEAFGDRLLIRSYTLMGMRGDADLLLWQIGERLEDVQELTSQLMGTALGAHLSVPYSYLALTRRSIYVAKDEPAGARSRTVIRPADSKYLFVYPFVKTRAWYKLPREERQRMMDEHIAVGRRYPSVKLNTTYSYGIDDQEFVVAFETDEPADFLDLVMELRETEASAYTLRDTPTFTGIAMPLAEAIDSLCGASAEPAPLASGRDGARAEEWLPVARLSELPDSGAKVIYVRGEQIALFNQAGRVYALGNRCSHANGPLSEGTVEGTTVTCPWHNSQFDLNSGEPLGGPASRPVPSYRVRVSEGVILVAAGQSAKARRRQPVKGWSVRKQPAKGGARK